MEQAIKKLKDEIKNFYDEKLQESQRTIGELELNLKSINSLYSLPTQVTQPIEDVRLESPSNNIRIPSPVAIGQLKSSEYSTALELPAYLDFIAGNGLCIDLANDNDTEAHQWLQNIGLKILSSTNPGVADVVVIDHEGSGSNFKLLNGYEKAKPYRVLNKSEVNSRLSSILAGFNRIETESLTLKYDDLEQLNLNEGKLTKPYTFIFISHYPSGFNSEGIAALKKIITKGGKFGTFVFMTFNPAVKAEYGKEEEVCDAVKFMSRLQRSKQGYKLVQSREEQVYHPLFYIQPDAARPTQGAELVTRLNNYVKDAAQKPVTQDEYFEKIFSGEIPLWSQYTDADGSNAGIKAPIGLKSATEEIDFTIDCGTDNFHAIVGGKTGAGKTVLIDNIIINAALKYSPEELQFVLLDFKGASFQKYKRLPHTKILFCGNDRAYGLNVLRFLDAENTRRQGILATAGAKISALTKEQRLQYNFPRMVIILDEFQILLKEMDALKTEASRLIDTIAQQGRSAGMHLILSSQDLTGISISESTQLNANLRIALSMDPVACKMIFCNDNTEASELDKKGQAVYNEKPGRPRFGNQRFQVYYLDDKVSKRVVDFVSDKYAQSSLAKIDRFFLPNESSSSASNNPDMLRALGAGTMPAGYPKLYIGAPTFIKLNKKTNKKEDSYFQFRRAENSHLLVGGNDINTACSVIGLSLLQLMNQQQPATSFHVLNTFGADKSLIRERFQALAGLCPNYKYYSKANAVDLFTLVENEINVRKADEQATLANFYLVILNLDSAFQKQGLSVSDLSKRLNAILKQGSDLGVHVILYSYVGKSVVGAGIEPDLFENKLVVKGDGKDIIKYNEGPREPEKEKQAFLYAPTPVTSINPDLLNTYVELDENAFAGANRDLIFTGKQFLTDFVEE